MCKINFFLLVSLLWIWGLPQATGQTSRNRPDSRNTEVVPAKTDSCSKVYVVKKVQSAPVIDGVSMPGEWGEANLMKDIVLHWEQKNGQNTLFKATFDQKNFYFLFEAEELNPVVWPEISQEMDVVWEDRVEIFLGQDRQFKKYYCLEIDPLGRYLGNSGSLGQKIDVSWECRDCNILGKEGAGGYVVEGAIPLSTLTEMGVFITGKPMIAGVYRADFISSGNPNEPEMHWMSWVKSDSPTPNFHIPSSAGCFVFE